MDLLVLAKTGGRFYKRRFDTLPVVVLVLVNIIMKTDDDTLTAVRHKY